MKVFETFRKSRWSCAVLVATLIPSVSLVTLPVGANPTGPAVIAGGISFNGLGTGGLTINQSTSAAIINWQSFSIAAGESTHFNQAANAIALNRVVGVNPSAIYGTLSATGSVIVVNQNGIMVGPGGLIDVNGSLALSTLDIDNSDFLNGGSNRFFGNSTNGVSSFGSIRAANGDVLFLGGFAHNFGSIEATRGAVALASGSDILVDQAGESMISVRGASSYDGVGVNQQGTVTGNAVELQSHGNAYALAINNGGITRATGGYKRNGRSVLKAMGGSSRIVNTGTIEARNPNGRGGEIRMEGSRVENSGTLDASSVGANDGGSIDVIADSIVFSDTSVVKATSVGNSGSVNLNAGASADIDGMIDVSSTLLKGGEVIVTADEVMVNAQINAIGGRQGGSIKAGGDFQGISVNGLKASDTSVIGQGASFDASATMGNAGQIIVWSDGDTFFEGEARANATGTVGNGGLIEVSGKQNLTFRGLVSASSLSGNAGTVLFDPGELRVGNGLAGVNEISNQVINGLLQGGTSVLLATQGADSDIIFVDNGLGDDVNNAIQWTKKANFGAFAGGDIIVGTHIRTSGEGSINLIGGWSGTEDEAISLMSGFGFVGIPDRTGDGVPEAAAGTGSLLIHDLFDYYVTNGQFGANNGNVVVGSATMNRHVEVGSRYGDTNVAGYNILVIAADTNAESRHAQIGFRDSGQVFAPRRGTLDLNTRALEADNNVLVGVAGLYETTGASGTQLTNGSGTVIAAGTAMGVYAIDKDGVHTDTLIPYANHYMDARQGNWWWQRIASNSGDTGLGANRPEMGAGLSATNGADVNVIAKANVLVQGGGRHQSQAQIGHGGDSAGWGDNRAVAENNDANLQSGSDNGVTSNQTLRIWSQNGATNDRSAMAIARLAPVYGNINVLAGVNTSAGVSFDNNGNVTATITPGAGSVIVSGLQRMGSSNNKTNENQNDAGAGAAALIGHGGLGQFGEFNGDIQVRAGGSVQVQAGSNTRGVAQIGHNIDTYHYWDPPSNANHQIRFFSDKGGGASRNENDIWDPQLRRGELYSGTTNIQAGTIASGNKMTGARAIATGQTATNLQPGGVRELSNPVATGFVVVEALDGSVVTGFHGNVTVEAVAGSVTVQGYNSTTTSNTNRDRRYARIGHGGTSSAVWAEDSGFVPNRTDRDTEQVAYRLPTNNTETGASTVIGEVSSSLNRAMSFMTITGDISVTAGGNVSIKAGNDIYDLAQIGHGGNELADYETSSFIAGNVSVNAGGSLTITGGGEVQYTGNANDRHLRAQAQVGHGGYLSGFLGYFGDITVTTGTDITITGGAYGDSYAKIGHQGSNDFGQVGGNFSRSENFELDSVSTNIVSTVSGNTATVTYSNGASAALPGGRNGTDNLSGGFVLNGGGTKTRTFNLTTNTANISVNSGGTVKLAHLDAQVRQNPNQLANGNVDINANQMEDAYAQIGHGGNNWAGEYWRNTKTNYDDIVGNVTVNAATDLILEGGNREGMWSRVGHGFTGNNVRVNNGEELLVGGQITVTVGRDVILDGAKAGEIDVNQDQPAKDNGLVIGHGVMNYDEGGTRGQLAVLDGGLINGISLPSTITVTAGRDITIQGGNGAQDIGGEVGSSGTHSQIGHGTSSFDGNAGSTRGFQGDINVSAMRNILIRATDNGIVHDAAGSIVYASSGGAAFIGNGGLHMDAPASGDITVYAGKDLSIVAPRRRAVTPIPIVGEEVGRLGTGSDAGFTNLNFAKIGHVSTENADSAVVSVGLMEGDITIVVGNNMTMQGGESVTDSSVNFTDIDGSLGGNQGVTFAFAQVGHGGPGINGTLLGDIEVLVGGNLTTRDGSIDNSANTLANPTPLSANNYVKIGHGDWMREGTVGSQGAATGVVTGDIVVAVGGSADLEHTLIGHSDPTVSGLLPGGGTTTIAVSRNNPFFGATGSLTATGVRFQADAVGATLRGTGVVSGSVFTSGSLGGDPLSIYIPQRDLNLMAMNSTRLNTTNVFYHGNNGGGTPGSISLAAADEVFLSPDLWWMNDTYIAEATAAGFTTTGSLPTSAGAGQGGVVATVNDPGGIPNLVTLTAGALGSSPNGSTYKGGHGLSGGQYTLFYDAVEPVATVFPILPPAPIVLPENPGSLGLNGGPLFNRLYETVRLSPLKESNVLAYNVLAGFVSSQGVDVSINRAENQIEASEFETFGRLKEGFDGYLGGPGLVGDLPYFGQSNDQLNVPNFFAEAMLDLLAGPRTEGTSAINSGAIQGAGANGEEGSTFGPSSNTQLEDQEEMERRANREGRPVGNNTVIYYLYSPGSVNPYSSFSLFGTPQ